MRIPARLGRNVSNAVPRSMWNGIYPMAEGPGRCNGSEQNVFIADWHLEKMLGMATTTPASIVVSRGDYVVNNSQWCRTDFRISTDAKIPSHIRKWLDEKAAR